MLVVKGKPVEWVAHAGGGNAKGDWVPKKWVGHNPANLALAWNAMAAVEPGKEVPMKALLAAAAVKGAKWVGEMLKAGGAEAAYA
jgi:hypothetical protein